MGVQGTRQVGSWLVGKTQRREGLTIMMQSRCGWKMGWRGIGTQRENRANWKPKPRKHHTLNTAQNTINSSRTHMNNHYQVTNNPRQSFKPNYQITKTLDNWTNQDSKNTKTLFTRYTLSDLLTVEPLAKVAFDNTNVSWCIRSKENTSSMRVGCFGKHLK